MKLAEALQERADLNRRIEQLRIRLCNNAVYQKGTKTTEDPNELLNELNRCCEELQTLIAKINQANCRITVNGRTLTEMIAEKDVLTMKISVYQNLINDASRGAYRARNTEILILSAVDVRTLQKEVDAMSASLRTLNNQLQAANWSEEL